MAYSIFPSPFCVLVCFVQRCQTVPPPPPETFAPAHTVPTALVYENECPPHTEGCSSVVSSIEATSPNRTKKDYALVMFLLIHRCQANVSTALEFSF